MIRLHILHHAAREPIFGLGIIEELARRGYKLSPGTMEGLERQHPGSGHDNEPGNFGATEDYLVGLSWRIGPGGLFDYWRIGASTARLAANQLGNAKLKDAVTAQVITR